MGNIIPFPAKRILRRQPTPQQKESESKTSLLFVLKNQPSIIAHVLIVIMPPYSYYKIIVIQLYKESNYINNVYSFLSQVY